MRTLNETAPDRRFAVDTTFVLFFLALDLGLSLGSAGIDTFLSLITLAAFIAIPYLLPTWGAKPDFTRWVTGRVIIAAFAVGIGAALQPAFGGIIPEGFRYLPMTLLIVSAAASCYIQFFSVLRLRLAK